MKHIEANEIKSSYFIRYVGLDESRWIKKGRAKKLARFFDSQLAYKMHKYSDT